MARKRQKWQIGDTFGVQAIDGQYVIGQVVERVEDPLGCITVALFDLRVKNLEEAKNIDLKLELVFSVVFTTRDLLACGEWPVIEHRQVSVPAAWFPHADKRAAGWVGATVFGSGIIEDFLNAYYALRPWDDSYDPDYYDRLLLNPSKKPKKLLLSRGANKG
jgi:hypothetical protein